MSDLAPDVLSAYLDGELSEAERALVEARLSESAAWREELDEVRAARAAVRGLPVREAPDGFWDAVHSELAMAEVVPITAVAERRRRRPVVWLAAGVAAAAAIVAVIVIPQRSQVAPNVAAVIAQHGAHSAEAGDPVSLLAPVGPLAGFRR